jgi:oxygen-independent coproporphyrinogen-3 oxidase
MDLYSLYLHVPFCRHRCSYCDFNTFAGQERRIPAFVNAICQEIRQVSGSAMRRPEGGPPPVEPLPVHTIFFGGGTPSLLSGEQIGAILSTLRANFHFQEEMEVTLEGKEALPV